MDDNSVLKIGATGLSIGIGIFIGNWLFNEYKERRGKMPIMERVNKLRDRFGIMR